LPSFFQTLLFLPCSPPPPTPFFLNYYLRSLSCAASGSLSSEGCVTSGLRSSVRRHPVYGPPCARLPACLAFEAFHVQWTQVCIFSRNALSHLVPYAIDCKIRPLFSNGFSWGLQELSALKHKKSIHKHVTKWKFLLKKCIFFSSLWRVCAEQLVFKQGLDTKGTSTLSDWHIVAFVLAVWTTVSESPNVRYRASPSAVVGKIKKTGIMRLPCEHQSPCKFLYGALCTGDRLLVCYSRLAQHAIIRLAVVRRPLHDLRSGWMHPHVYSKGFGFHRFVRILHVFL
jgi:hypothetical protein